MLKHIILLLSILTTTYFCQDNIYAQKHGANIDSILQKMHVSAEYYEANTPDFEAEMYIKGTLHVQKRNAILRIIPYFRKIDKHKDQYFVELSSNFSYTRPNIYTQTFNAISTNSKDIISHIEGNVLPYIKGNVYSSYLYGNYYSPIAKKAGKYYKYTIESKWINSDITYYKIIFTPKLKSYQLLSGYIIINSNNWSIRSLFIKGKTELVNFSNYIEMGDIGSNSEFLTKNYNIVVDFHLLGNKLSGEYSSYLKYNKTVQPEPQESTHKGKYDLSLLYEVAFNKKIKDNIYLDSIRPIPLTLTEKETVKRYNTERDSIIKIPDTSSHNTNTFLSLGKFLVSNYGINMNDYGKIQFSPIISPVLFNFSTSNGLSYAQRIKYNKNFKGDRLLYIEPKIGYNFKHKELYWHVRSNFDYAPKRNSSIIFEIVSGNKIGTDKILDDLKALPDTIFDYSKIHLNDFRNGYLKIGHKIEVANGFTVSAIMAMHRYSEVEKSDLTIINPQSQYIKRAMEIAQRNYTSFVPEIEVNWTPHQYYYMEGNRKVNLYSKYPTFSLNWAYAIKGALKSSTTFQRIEFDMQHKIRLGLMETLCYRFGIGGFFNYSNLYFADFLNFQRNNLPEGWDDEIGGTFQLLSSSKYNEITRYIRGHVKYDAPFLLLPTVLRWVPYITKERIYCNVLFVNTLKPYIELGYGIGTNLFNIGIFFGGEVNKFDLVGFKFTFEIFNN
ncbi:MAG: DUF5686 family protein [Bacteroidales bacterium]